MSDDEILERLRAIAPRPPADPRFWEDFGRGVRRAWEQRPPRTWPWALATLAAAAALVLLPNLPDRSREGGVPAAATAPAPHVPAPLPPADDVEELSDDELHRVLTDLGDDDDLDVEDLTDDELRLLDEALKGA